MGQKAINISKQKRRGLWEAGLEVDVTHTHTQREV